MNLEKPLEGNDAWYSLVKVLKEDRSTEEFCCSEIPLERLRLCIQDKPNSNLSEKDRLVRLRQALRYGSIKLSQDSLPLPKKDGWPGKKNYIEFGQDVKRLTDEIQTLGNVFRIGKNGGIVKSPSLPRITDLDDIPVVSSVVTANEIPSIKST